MDEFFRNVGSTQAQLDGAADCAIINGCLVLKQQEYKKQQFKDRKDIKAVYALNVTTIPDFMFSNCSNLLYAYLLRVVTVGNNSFQSCEQLISLVAPKLNGIGPGAFSGCLALDLSGNYPITQKEIDEAKDGEIINKHLILKKDKYPQRCYKGRNEILFVHAQWLKAVSNSMFYDCRNMQTLDIPLVEVVENSGILGCYSLKQIATNQLQSVHEYGFAGCISMEAFSFPCLKEAKSNAFQDCWCLQQFVAPQLHTLGQRAFASCSELKLIQTPLLQTDHFKCGGCNSCPVCRNTLQSCLQRGQDLAVYGVSEIDFEVQNPAHSAKTVLDTLQQEVQRVINDKTQMKLTIDAHEQTIAVFGTQIEQLILQNTQKDQQIAQQNQVINQLQENQQNQNTVHTNEMRQMRTQMKQMNIAVLKLIQNLK